ncbi:putative membrane protein [Salsuginibacillus halophilus]|uniref:Putative membrane protein n=1 Tax=Salsuginibacillus halophilus TaxID=517424 RepID=A0A2P8HAR9_9BACI|nr:TIGR03943 family protein [Salsuginibacillus halophilus]PSL43279.1 putative membrane protein [Salsuginibacillus halophilus]
MNEERDYSFHAYLRGIFLLGFALLNLGLIMTGNIQLYIASHMMPLIYFATVVLFLLGVIQIIRSTSKNGNIEAACQCGSDHGIEGPKWIQTGIYSIFLLPLVLGFALPDHTFDSSVAEMRGIQYGSGQLAQEDTGPDGAEAAETDESNDRAEAYMDDPDGYLTELDEDAAPEGEDHYTVEEYYDQEQFDNHFETVADEYGSDNFVEVDDTNFLDIMTALDHHLHDFTGTKMEVMGFVYREPEFEDDQMVVARFSMTCCIADATVYGVLVEGEGAEAYEQDDWVRVRGTVEEGEYMDETLPQIQAESFEDEEEPDNPYVYPSFQ